VITERSSLIPVITSDDVVLKIRKEKLNTASVSGFVCAETKNQWARDDPAFVVICSFLLAVAASAFCAAYVPSYVHTLLITARVLLNKLIC